MMRDIFIEAMGSLSANKVRSGLTLLGIVIGIASVIAMVSIGQGAQASIESNIESIGSNLIIVYPGAQRTGGVNAGRGSIQTLTADDAAAIRVAVSGIKAVAPEVSRRYQITAGGSNTNTEVIGTTESYLVVRNVSMDIGSFLSDRDEKSSAKIAVLGSSARDDLFGEGADPIGRFIRINNVDFLVVGVTLPKGGSGFSNPDNSVYIPLSSAQHFLSGSDFVNTISIAAENQGEMASVQSEISDLLLSRHHIADATQADFGILNQNDILATASNITATFTAFLSSIAGISLLVGGIGIMNMMLTTVMERTREIGLRKAVGIRRVFIRRQFLAESVILTMLGGTLGVILGWIFSVALSTFANIPTTISLSSVTLAFGVSAVTGIVFGIYPAERAARMSPIEALRYE